MKLRNIGERVYFARARTGNIVGYSTFKRQGHMEEVDTYYVVQLSPESSAYLETEGGLPHDCFVSLLLVHPNSVDGGERYPGQRAAMEAVARGEWDEA